MPVTELELFLIILLDTITSFFIGAIIGGNLVRFPFRTRSYAGVESIIGRRCRVSSVSGKRIEVVANSQIWAAVAVNEGENFYPGEMVLVKGVEGLRLQIEKLK
jgi:membrane protein implicated in regulation of membrane protease activity